MMNLRKYIKYLRTAKIYYKLEDDKLRVLTPFNYIYKRGKVFEKGYADNYYKVKKNVKYVHFYMTGLNGEIAASDFTDVVVSERVANLNLCDMFCISGGNSLYVATHDKDYSPLFGMKVSNPSSVKLSSNRYVVSGEEISLQGDIRGMKQLLVKGKSLEISESDISLLSTNFEGDSIKFTKVKGNMYKFLARSGRKIEFNNSDIFSDKVEFVESAIPKFEKSLFLVASKMVYNDVVYGNRDEGIVIDSMTRFDQDSVEMARARLSYSLSKLNEKVEKIEKDDTKPLYIDIDDRKEKLTEWYEEQWSALENERVEIKHNFEKQKVKTLIKKED